MMNILPTVSSLIFSSPFTPEFPRGFQPKPRLRDGKFLMEALHSHGFGLPLPALPANDIRFRTCRLGIPEKYLFINPFSEPGLVLSAVKVECPRVA